MEFEKLPTAHEGSMIQLRYLLYISAGFNVI